MSENSTEIPDKTNAGNKRKEKKENNKNERMEEAIIRNHINMEIEQMKARKVKEESERAAINANTE
jgi:hypothetical protein